MNWALVLVRIECPKLKPSAGDACLHNNATQECPYDAFECPDGSFATNATTAVCDATTLTWLVTTLTYTCDTAPHSPPSPFTPPIALPIAPPPPRPPLSPGQSHGSAYTVALVSACGAVCAIIAMCLWWCRGGLDRTQGDAKPLLASAATGAPVRKASEPPWTFRSLSVVGRR